MKQMLPLCLAIILLLCSCGSADPVITIKELPSGGTATYSSNGDSSGSSTYSSVLQNSNENSSGHQNSGQAVSSKTVSSGQNSSDNKHIVYVANSKTKKFHLSTCTYAKKTTPANKFEATDRFKLIAEGYSPCGHCHP